MQREPVMPRTFGDQIPQRRYSQQPLQYGNREQREHSQQREQREQAHSNAQSQQSQAQRAHIEQQRQSVINVQTENESEKGTSGSSSIRPPPLNVSANVTKQYAYPGMISAAELSAAAKAKANDSSSSSKGVQPIPETMATDAVSPNESPMNSKEFGAAQSQSNSQSPTKSQFSLQFASLGLTQDTQLQDIVQQMDALHRK